jgi:hypothetical protein
MKIKNILKSKFTREGHLFFVVKGERSGQFLLFLKLDKEKSIYSVLGLPECEPIYISNSELIKYQDDKLIEFVETVPKNILAESISEFNLRKSQLKG